MRITKLDYDQWYKMLYALNHIPNEDRSQNHTNYLREVESRVYECKEALEFLGVKLDEYES